MKKKILFGLGVLTLVVVVALTLNVNFAKSTVRSESSLQAVAGLAQAQAEDGGCFCCVKDANFACYYNNQWWVGFKSL